jgi:antitoxin CcdA
MLTKPRLRKSVNLSLNVELVAEAKALHLNVSRLAEEGIAAAVREEKGRRWKEENREAMESWNEWVRENGLPFAEYRGF